MRQFDDMWKAYCGWCGRVVAIRQDKKEAEEELLRHRLFMRCGWEKKKGET